MTLSPRPFMPHASASALLTAISPMANAWGLPRARSAKTSPAANDVSAHWLVSPSPSNPSSDVMKPGNIRSAPPRTFGETSL